MDAAGGKVPLVVAAIAVICAPMLARRWMDSLAQLPGNYGPFYLGAASQLALDPRSYVDDNLEQHGPVFKTMALGHALACIGIPRASPTHLADKLLAIVNDENKTASTPAAFIFLSQILNPSGPRSVTALMSENVR